MDYYQNKSSWKFYLAIAGVLIVLISLFYSNFLANKLAEEERSKADIWAQAMEDINDLDEEDYTSDCDFTLQNQILIHNTTIPVIIVNDKGGIDAGINFGSNLDTNHLELSPQEVEFLKKEVEKMQKQDFEPIQGFAYSIYYKESKILKQLRYFPIIQLVLIGAFILFGYTAFNMARRSEQNRVWVGMAKETAHQLGTPISAIIAWIEHLKLMREGDPEVEEIASELQNDVNRLELIADRFSKIGSAPKLEPVDAYKELEKCKNYMKIRAPRKVVFEMSDPPEKPTPIHINSHLFDWVIENLMRNALDAMEGKGKIGIKLYDEKNHVCIDLSDTGKGIPGGKFKSVFKPGYTTKKRGWGLGLSLAKRIVEEYHSGKIYVKESTENKGTTFTIKLPKKDLV